jgi:hypothetical protein
MSFATRAANAAAICLVCATAPALADEWSIEPSLTSRWAYNDNINMLPLNPQGSASLSLVPAAKFAQRTESRDTSLHLRASFNRYAAGPVLNETDHFIDLASSWSAERAQWSLGASSVRDSTLGSELANTGIVQARTQRRDTNLRPSWQYSLADDTVVSADYSLATVRYNQAPGLVDYSTRAAGASLRHELSERTSLGASISTSRFRTDPTDTSANTNTATLNWTTEYSERLRVTANVGRQRTHTDRQLTTYACRYGSLYICYYFGIPFDVVLVPKRYEDKGLTIDFAANFKRESGSIDLTASRAVASSGTGTPLRTDRIGLAVGQGLGDTLALVANVSAVRSHYLDNSGSDVSYLALGSSLQWKLDPQLVLGSGLAWSRQRIQGQVFSVHSREVFLSLAYTPQPLAAAR